MSDQAGERVWLHFGGIPEDGRSINWSRSEYEEGMSVFEAERVRDGYYVLKNLDVRMAVTAGVCLASGAPLYEVSGTEIVGKGADGEPLLADVEATPINRPTTVEAEGYERLVASIVLWASEKKAERGPQARSKFPLAEHPPRPSNADDLLTDDDDPEVLEAFEELKSGLEAVIRLNDRRRRIESPSGPSAHLADLFSRGSGISFPFGGVPRIPRTSGNPFASLRKTFRRPGGGFGGLKGGRRRP